METIAYSGIIEKSITKNPDGSGIHFPFGTEGFISQKGRKGSSIFIAHIEYLATKKDNVRYFSHIIGCKRKVPNLVDKLIFRNQFC